MRPGQRAGSEWQDDARRGSPSLGARDFDLSAVLVHELARLSAIVLRVIGGVTMGVPLVFLAIGLVWLPVLLEQLEVTLSLVLLGLAALRLSYWAPAHPQARSVGLVVGYVVACLPRSVTS
jgi:hypothetical protein